jgi:hypothetical protein
MTVMTAPTTLEDHAPEAPAPATLETAPPTEVRRDLAWLLAQAYISTPLIA